MKDAQKPDHVSLNTLIMRLKEGRFVIPDFQREFEWRPWDIRDLMRSIFLDYYIGSLLLWKGKKENFAALSCEPIYGYEGAGRPDSIVLDGQQRLTAMYYAFLAPDVSVPHRASRAFYFINIEKFMAEVYDEAFGYDWLSQRLLKMLASPETQYAEHFFPLSVIGAGGRDLYKWIDGYEKFWLKEASEAEASGNAARLVDATHHAENAVAFDEYLRGIIDQYQISYIELDQDLGIDKVCDIFTQINSRGIRLDIFDLMNALLKPKNLQLKKMWRDAAPRLEFVNSEKMNVYILQVMSILRQNYCSPKYLYFLLPGQEKTVRNPDGSRQKEILITDIDEFEQRWNQAVSALEEAIKLLQQPQEYGAISSDYLPYVSILPIFAALQAHVKTIPTMRRLDAQRKIRHWYWASVFNNRYSGSVESTSARDFIDLKAWIDDDAAEPSLVFEFSNTYRNIDLYKETKRGTSVYNGIFNLLVLQGARDWMGGTVPQHDNLDDHHIIPASKAPKLLKPEQIRAGLIHTILNRTPLTAETNRHVIRDRLPNEYLPELIEASGEATVRAILESHFISPAAFSVLLRDPFVPDDFQAFIAERQKTILEAMENLLIKERLDLSPQLRELDATIERVELSIREIIQSILNGDGSLIPSHVLVKVDERISRASKKTAALNGDYYQSLPGKLEYFDLRELQETIISKALWPLFEPRFVNKETFLKKFDQLAELRNGIRHSRTVDVITRKEGEAAILWFEQVLRK